MTKLEQAARQALDALESAPVQYDFNSYPMLVMTPDTLQTTLTALREALAEQAEQEPVMDYERINALREGEQNRAENAYFFVRPENNTPTLRKMFCQGFERGFHKGLKYAAPVRTKDLTDDEVADCGDFAGVFTLTDLQFARAVIAADREKNRG